MTSVPIDRVIEEVYRSLRKGDIVRTVGMVKELARQARQDPRSRLLQAKTAIEFGQAAEAVKLLETLVFELTGEQLSSATIDLARAQMMAGDLESAHTTIRPEIEAETPAPAAIAVAAQIQFQMGNEAEALSLLDNASPDEKHAYEIARARGYVALDTGADNPDLANREQAAIETLKAETQRVGVPACALMPMLIDLGELLARRGEDEQAARAWKRSAGLNPNRIDPRTYAKSVADLAGSWNDKAVSRARTAESGPGGDTERPVFIVGLPGGSASLAAAVLSAHPDIVIAGDREALTAAVGRHLAPASAEGQPIVPDPAKLTGKQLASAAEVYLSRTASGAETASRVVDPFELNLHTLGVIPQLFPKATVIFIKRDPFDACLASMLAHRDPRLLYVHDPRALAVFAGGLRRLVDLWEGIFSGDDLPLRHTTIDHDALISDPAARKALFEEIGMEAPDDSALEAAVKVATRNTPCQSGLGARFASNLTQLAEAAAHVGTDQT